MVTATKSKKQTATEQLAEHRQLVSAAVEEIIGKLARDFEISRDERETLQIAGLTSNQIIERTRERKRIDQLQARAGFGGKFAKAMAEIGDARQVAMATEATIAKRLQSLETERKDLEQQRKQNQASIQSAEAAIEEMLSVRRELRSLAPEAVRREVQAKRMDLADKFSRPIDRINVQIRQLEDFATNAERPQWVESYIERFSRANPDHPLAMRPNTERIPGTVPDLPRYVYDGDAWLQHKSEKLAELAKLKAEREYLQGELEAGQAELDKLGEVYFLAD